MNRGQLPARLLPTLRRGRPTKTERPHPICRNTPSHIMSPTRSQPGPSAEVSLGVRGHTSTTSARTASVKRFALAPTGRPAGDRAPPLTLDRNEVAPYATTSTNHHDPRGLTGPPETSKQSSAGLVVGACSTPGAA